MRVPAQKLDHGVNEDELAQVDQGSIWSGASISLATLSAMEIDKVELIGVVIRGVSRPRELDKQDYDLCELG